MSGLIEWEGAAGEGALVLDAVRTYGFEVAAEVTKHPVETGTAIADDELAFDAHASETAREFMPKGAKGDGDGAGFAVAEEERKFGRLPVLLTNLLKMRTGVPGV